MGGRCLRPTKARGRSHKDCQPESLKSRKKRAKGQGGHGCHERGLTLGPLHSLGIRNRKEIQEKKKGGRRKRGGMIRDKKKGLQVSVKPMRSQDRRQLNALFKRGKPVTGRLGREAWKKRAALQRPGPAKWGKVSVSEGVLGARGGGGKAIA